MHTITTAFMAILGSTGAVLMAVPRAGRADEGPLPRATETFTLHLHAPVADAFPLFGPVRESEWAPHWAPTFIHRVDGGQGAGSIFTVSGPHGDALWVLTEFDHAAARAAYVTVVPGLVVTEIKIALAEEGRGRCTATVTYRKAALAPSANEIIRRLNPEWAASEQPHWEQAINAVLDRRRSRR